MKKAKKFRSLTVTLAIAFLALSVAVLLIAGSLSMYFSLQNQQKLIINEQRFIAQNAANTVKSFVQGKFDVLKTAAGLGDLIASSQQEQKLILEKLLGCEPAFRQLVLFNAQEQELLRDSRLSNLLAGQMKKQIEQDSSELFSQTRQREIYISSVYIDEITSEPMVMMAVPVINVFGDFQGALAAEVNLKFMWDLVGGIKVGNKGRAYVVDRQGKLIASGDVSRVLKGENLIYLNEVNKFVKGDLLTHKDGAKVVKGIQENLVVANHAHLGTPDWAVVVELPVLEAYETVITTLVISGLIMLLSFALAIIFGVFLSKRIAKPIISLRDAAVRIGQGRLDTQIEIKKNDEIGDLAAAFNQMTGNLRKTTTSIDNLNREMAERKKAEEVLRKSEEFTKRIIESSSDCIKVLDLEGRLLSMSEGGQKILEIDDITPYLNMSFVDYWKGKEKEDCLEAISKAKQGDTGIFYGYFQTAKGKPKWWEVIITPIKDADGSINRLLAVSRDITERKLAEQRQAELLEQLEKTNQELKDFAYIVSHDLKAPLRGIKTLAEWISTDYADKLDDNGKEQISLLGSRVDRMHNLIDGILQYSRVGRVEEEKVVVNLNELVPEIIDLLAPPENVTITIENTLPMIECEPTRIMQVFQNLLSNAVKYMDKPKGQIKVDCVEEDGFWKFSVADNGPGIEEKHFGKIFQLFQTLSPRDESQSTGIGLTVIKKIVELYNGKIWVESEPGQGSTFFFTLPKQETGVKDAKLETVVDYK
ncbi:MAG: ATP-binding protein [Phycisphaerae bacterium]|nr:ATP-binding protein [Phycisphaerae bacterium]MDD5380947.1 ATP-binding protein [Phycisphaerae bacterium]